MGLEDFVNKEETYRQLENGINGDSVNRNYINGQVGMMLLNSPLRFGRFEKCYELDDKEFSKYNKELLDKYFEKG